MAGPLRDPLAWLPEADMERERNPFDPVPEPWQPPVHEETHTMQEWREVRIQDGTCPLPGCSGTLDEDFFCARCGNVSLPHQSIELQPDDAAEMFPQEFLPVDEFAPAALSQDEIEAA